MYAKSSKYNLKETNIPKTTNKNHYVLQWI